MDYPMVNVSVFSKDEHRYILIYHDERAADALRTLGRWATNPELPFTWYDAAVFSKRIRQCHEAFGRAAAIERARNL